MLKFALRVFKPQKLVRVLPHSFNHNLKFAFCTTPNMPPDHTELLIKSLNNIKQQKGHLSIEYINSLSLLAEHYKSINSLEEAEKAYLELVEITATHQGDGKLRFKFLVKVLQILSHKEDFKKSTEILLKMLEIQEANSKNSSDYFKTLENLSLCYQRQGKRSEMKKYVLLNIQALKNYPGERNEEYRYNEFTAKFRLGEIYLEARQYDSAFVSLKEALSLLDQNIVVKNPYLLDLLLYIIAHLDKNSQAEMAKHIYPSWKKAFWMLPSEYPKVYKLPWVAAMFSEDHQEQLEILQEWRNRLLKRQGKTDYYVQLLKTEAKCLAKTKRFDECFELMMDAKEIVEKFPTRNLVLEGETLCYLGLAKFQLQAFNEGMLYFKEGMGVLIQAGEEGQDIKSQFEIAMLEILMEGRHYERIIEVAKGALSTNQFNTLEDDFRLSLAISDAYRGLEKLQEGLDFLLKCFSLLKEMKEFGSERYFVVTTYIADTYMKLQRFEDSKLYLDEAEKILNKFPNSPVLFGFFDNSINYYYSQQQFDRAEQVCKDAIRKTAQQPELQQRYKEILDNLRNAQ